MKKEKNTSPISNWVIDPRKNSLGFSDDPMDPKGF